MSVWRAGVRPGWHGMMAQSFLLTDAQLRYLNIIRRAEQSLAGVGLHRQYSCTTEPLEFLSLLTHSLPSLASVDSDDAIISTQPPAVTT